MSGEAWKEVEESTALRLCVCVDDWVLGGLLKNEAPFRRPRWVKRKKEEYIEREGEGEEKGWPSMNQ